ncbi:MAG: alpha/beta fold hydrolase [Acetobacteraceae bacterium]|nr:alpha/beta fold hydrolase [Acetobacteraceae bacterium]
MADWPTAEGIFAPGDVPVAQGGAIRNCRVVWKTHGTLNAARDNVVLYPCSYGAAHQDMEFLIGPDGILDPTRWFIVIPDMFSNGASSGAADTPDFPVLVTYADLIEVQRRLLDEVFAIRRLAAVYGFSMGAQQAYHWAALHPGMVERAFVLCGTARTSVHNKVFHSGLLRTLEAAPEHIGDGRFSGEPVLAKKAFAHIYAGWALSQDFYRAGLHMSVLGAPDLDTYLRTDWTERMGARPAANLYAQLMTWYHGDIADGGDLAAALRAITARMVLMPSETDLYFRVADNAAEMPFLKNAVLKPIPSIWGHRAGNPNPAVLPDEFAFVKAAVRKAMAE